MEPYPYENPNCYWRVHGLRVDRRSGVGLLCVPQLWPETCCLTGKHPFIMTAVFYGMMVDIGCHSLLPVPKGPVQRGPCRCRKTPGKSTATPQESGGDPASIWPRKARTRPVPTSRPCSWRNGGPASTSVTEPVEGSPGQPQGGTPLRERRAGGAV